MLWHRASGACVSRQRLFVSACETQLQRSVAAAAVASRAVKQGFLNMGFQSFFNLKNI